MAQPFSTPSLDDFLVWENAQQTRNEFCCGQIVEAGAARRVHGLVAGNLAAALKLHLKGTPCRAFSTSMKVQVGRDALFYPDVFVTCDPQDLRTDMVFRSPSLIVEVLSDSTQAYDRGLKFTAYRQIASLQEYALVDPDTLRVEVFRRNERQNFELVDQTGADDLVLDSVGLRLPMGEVFDGL